MIPCTGCYKLEKEAPNVGLEPTTLRLRVSCSTDWASRAAYIQIQFIIIFHLNKLMFHGSFFAKRFGIQQLCQIDAEGELCLGLL